MRLQADFEVVNRLLSGAGVKPKHRSARAQLSLGRKQLSSSCSAASTSAAATKTADRGEILLMVYTQQDRSGQKFRIHDNIEKIFDRFVGEGKCTIRVKDPPHDLCISKADPIQLRCLVKLIGRVAAGDRMLDNITLSSLAPPSCKQIKQLQTKLIIDSRATYPITTGFPSSLSALWVLNCGLKCVDSRILKLKNLVSLNLSHNSIRSMPDDWSSLPVLGELNLSSNYLEHLPPTFLSHLSNTIFDLDLSHNVLSHVPYRITSLTSLTRLILSHNCLLCLPPNIHRLNKLRTLQVGHNRLTCLPLTIAKLNLANLDISGNAFCLLDSTCIKKSEWELTASVGMQAISFFERQIFNHYLSAQFSRITKECSSLSDHSHLDQFNEKSAKLALPSSDKRTIDEAWSRLHPQLKHQVTAARGVLARATSAAVDGAAAPQFARTVAVSKLYVPTLVECAARTVINQRIPYTPADIGTLLCDYLECAKDCFVCGGCSFTSLAICRAFVNPEIFSTTLVLDSNASNNRLPFEALACSEKCLYNFITDHSPII